MYEKKNEKKNKEKKNKEVVVIETEQKENGNLICTMNL